MLTKRDLRDLRLLMNLGIQEKWLLEILTVWFESVKKRDDGLREPEGNTDPPKELFQTELAQLGLPTREYYTLRRAGIETVGELAHMTPEELCGIDGVGALAYKRITYALGEFRGIGLTLRREKTVRDFEKWLEEMK